MIAVIIGAASLSVAPSGWPPTGEYLHLLDRVVYQYDAVLGTMTPLGISNQEFGCRDRGSSTSSYVTQQCGECSFIPTTTNAWQDNLTRYVHGRCASVNITAAVTYARVNVQLIKEPNVTWSFKMRAYYQAADGSLMTPPSGSGLTNPEMLDEGACSQNPVWCDSNVVTRTNLDENAGAFGAARYCVSAEIFKTTEGSAPVRDLALAFPCRNL